LIQKFGYDGLDLCMLLAAGLLRLGTLIKYIPQPVSPASRRASR
jgi:SulP family sulfate permease